MVGKFYDQIVATLPTWTSGDVGRKIYVTDQDRVYYGGAAGWKLSSFGLNWVDVTTATYTAAKDQTLLANTSSTAIEITTPVSPSKGDSFVVWDVRSNAGTNNITIKYTADKIDGAASDLTLSTNGIAAEFVYYDSTIGWAVNLFGRTLSSGSSSGGVGDIMLYPSNFVFDADTTGVDSGVAFGIAESLDFRYDLDGYVFGTIQFPSSWSATKDVLFKIFYNLNGDDASKAIILTMNAWVVDDGTTPALASPTLSGLSDTISSSSSNINKQNVLTLTNCKIPLANLTINTKEIMFYFGRNGTHASDTYGGTLQITKVIAYQA